MEQAAESKSLVNTLHRDYHTGQTVAKVNSISMYRLKGREYFVQSYFSDANETCDKQEAPDPTKK